MRLFIKLVTVSLVLFMGSGFVHAEPYKEKIFPTEQHFSALDKQFDGILGKYKNAEGNYTVFHYRKNNGGRTLLPMTVYQLDTNIWLVRGLCSSSEYKIINTVN